MNESKAHVDDDDGNALHVAHHWVLTLMLLIISQLQHSSLSDSCAMPSVLMRDLCSRGAGPSRAQRVLEPGLETCREPLESDGACILAVLQEPGYDRA